MLQNDVIKCCKMMSPHSNEPATWWNCVSRRHFWVWVMVLNWVKNYGECYIFLANVTFSVVNVMLWFSVAEIYIFCSGAVLDFLVIWSKTVPHQKHNLWADRGGWVVSMSDRYAGGLQSYLYWNTHVGKRLAAMLSTKRSADVAPEVDLRDYIACMPLPSANKTSPEVKNRGISGPQKGIMSSKNFEKNNLRHYNM